MRIKSLLISASIIMFIAGGAFSATIHVPSDQPTIQAGIDAAVDGDTVLVADGVYTGSGNNKLIIDSKSVSIIGASESSNIILELDNLNGVLIYDTLNSIVVSFDSLTFQNGNNAIYLNTDDNFWYDVSVSVQIKYCEFQYNDCGLYYGDEINLISFGISLENSVIEDNGIGISLNGGGGVGATSCHFLGNSTAIYAPSYEGSGGGHFSVDSCLFEGNNTALMGTGSVSNSTVQNGTNALWGMTWVDGIGHIDFQNVNNCTIEGITGMVFRVGVQTTVNNCEVINNPGEIATTYYGSDMYGGEILFYNSFISNNGGGVYSEQRLVLSNTQYIDNNKGLIFIGVTGYSELNIDNSLLAQNGTTAISINGSNAYNTAITNNTIANNNGDGIYIEDSDEITIANCVISNNAQYGIKDETSTLISVSCSNNYGNQFGNYFGISDQTGVNDNISEDPLFCDPINGNYGIDACSPCVPEHSQCGELIGALDVSCSGLAYCGPVWYVATDGSDETGDGSELNPFGTIQYAIDNSLDGDTILIKDGEFTGEGNRNIDINGKEVIIMSLNGPEYTSILNDLMENIVFNIHNGEDTLTKIIGITMGGSSYPNETDPRIMDVYSASPTFINCKFAFGGGEYRKAPVFLSDANCIFDNCMFADNTSGFSDAKIHKSDRLGLEDGGAMNITNGSDVRLINCQFSGNSTHYTAGGAVSIINSAAIINDCLFNNNMSSGIDHYPFGGAVSYINSTVEFTNCEFIDNTADFYLGGALYSGESSNSTINNCLFKSNHAEFSGGAIYASNSSISIFHSLFTANRCLNSHSYDNFGGAIYSDNASLNILNCSFYGNSLFSDEETPVICEGSAIYNVGNGPNIQNCVFAYNKTGRAVYCDDINSIPDITCSNIFGNEGGDWDGLIEFMHDINGNISENPFFCDTANGDFTLFNTSPCLPENNSCNELMGVLGLGCYVAVCDSIEVDTVGSNHNVVDHTPQIAWDFIDIGRSVLVSSELAVGTDDDWTYAEMWNPAPFQSADTFITYNGSPLLDGETYYLRLRVNNGLIWSDWYETTFRMNSVPMAPVPLVPGSDTVVQTDLPWLELYPSYDAEGDDITYDYLWVNDPSSGPPDTMFVIGDEHTTAQVTAPLNDNWRYLWAVRAYDGYEYSDWSDNESFRVNSVNQPPEAFATISPPDSADFPIYQMLPTFTWNEAADPDPDDNVFYTLIIAVDPEFNFMFELDSIPDTVFSLTDSLEFGEQYWWKVRATDSHDLTTESGNIRSFRTWKPGDVNADWHVDLLDILYLIDFKFKEGPEPIPSFSGDINGDCKIDLLDILYLIDYKFKDGPEPEIGCM